MNRMSRVPEYILEESEKILPTVNKLDNSVRDWSQVVVELEQSLQALVLAQDLFERITNSLRVSVLSLQEQQ